jgi:hypothetical protein
MRVKFNHWLTAQKKSWLEGPSVQIPYPMAWNVEMSLRNGVSPRRGDMSPQYKLFRSVSYSMHKRERGNIYHGHRHPLTQMVTYKPWPRDGENPTFALSSRCEVPSLTWLKRRAGLRLQLPFRIDIGNGRRSISAPSLPYDDRTGI